jgi:hypothetical protein
MVDLLGCSILYIHTEWNKVYCTPHCTFTVYFLSFSLVCMKVRDSEVLAWVRGHRKMSQVLGALGLLDFIT